MIATPGLLGDDDLPSDWDPSWIREERLARGMTQEELARAASVPNGIAASAERQSSDTRGKSVMRILRFGFGLTAEELAAKGAEYRVTGQWPT
jgi:transcriptional regulator with XRE-family HTH domain